MENYIYIYFNNIPGAYSLDEIEDDLTDLLGEQGEVTGTGIGGAGGNIDTEVYKDMDILKDIKHYLISCGFEKATVLDINGERESLY